MGAPGKRSRVPPREARLLARPPGVAEPPPSRSVWTPARPASVNGTFFSSSGCYLGGSGLGRGRVLWLVEDNPLDQGWGWETDFFGLPDSPRETGQGIGPALGCALPTCGNMPLPASPLLLPTFPERLRLRLATQRMLSWGVWRERWNGTWGWVAESVVSGKAGIFSSTARLPCLPPLFLSPACCRGPLQAPWEHHNLPFCSLPSPKDFSHPFWFIFCSDVCLPHAHPHCPPKKKKTK